MEFEIALYRVYERIVTGINLDYPIIHRERQRGELDEDELPHRQRREVLCRCKHMVYIGECLTLLLGLVLLVWLWMLHNNFVNTAGCLADAMKPYELNYNQSFHDTSDRLLRFSYNATNFFTDEEDASKVKAVNETTGDEFKAMYEYSSSKAMMELGMEPNLIHQYNITVHNISLSQSDCLGGDHIQFVINYLVGCL